MIVQVIAGEVGEGRAGEFNSGHSILVEGMRGNFHGTGPAAFVAHGGKQLGDFGGAGGGHGSGATGSAVVDIHGADQAAAALDRGEDVPDQIGGGGLSVRAGDAQDVNFVAGPLEEGVGEDRGGGGDVVGDDLRKR